MGAVTGTVRKKTEFSGQIQMLTITATLASASDTITLTLASHGVNEIVGVVGCVITGTPDANFIQATVTFSGLVLTVKSYAADGGASTAWTDADVEITVLAI